MTYLEMDLKAQLSMGFGRNSRPHERLFGKDHGLETTYAAG
jgi:hypothetical protein